MNELYLTLLGIIFIILARNSVPAVLFGILMFSHAILLGDLATTDPMTYMVTGGIFSTLAMAGCYAFREGVHDVIAFRMAAVSAACLFTNIVCILFWLQGSSMGGFNYVFAAILMAGIAVIIKGGRDGLGKSGRDTVGSHAYTPTNKVSNNVVGMENREAPK